jgi:hypothetical protein
MVSVTSATWVPAKEGDTPGQMDPQVWVATGRAGIPYHHPDDSQQATTRCDRWYGLNEHGEALRGELLTLTQAIAQYDARPCVICYAGEDE